MGKGMTMANRRDWVRNRYRGVPFSWWRMSRTGPWQRGGLIDVSASGVSLLVQQGELPETGRRIEVRFLRNRRPLPCRVVRVEPSRGVIGCRIASVENRRDEPRDYCPDVGVSWRTGRKGAWHAGWLYDTSASGLALNVQTQPPRAGEEIELAREDTGRRAHYRVLRTEVSDNNRVLLACRKVSPEPCHAGWPPSIEARSGYRWLPGTVAIAQAA